MKRAALLLLGITSLAGAAPPVPLRLDPFNGPHPSFSDQGGTVELKTGMSVRATPATAEIPPDPVLEFEYFCAGGVPTFAILPGPPYQAKTSRMLPAIGHSETWSTYAARIAPQGRPLPAGWKDLRMDLPLPAGRSIQIRKARLRASIPGEFEKRASTASVPEEKLRAYLDRQFPASLTRITVDRETVAIEGRAPGSNGALFLADIPMDVLLDAPESWKNRTPVTAGADGGFRIEVPRLRDRDGKPHDRLASRWQLIRVSPAGVEAVSHARHADAVACRAPDLPAAAPANKKGLGGWNRGRLPGELKDLGISAVTVNVMIHSLVSLQPGQDTTPFTWQGRTYHAREKVLAGYDATFLEAAKHQVMVSAILLVANPAKSADPVVKLLGHPDAVREGTFAMPNVTSPDGIALYGAILNLMAERWSRPDGKHGRVHHWIMHNEVDAGWVWTNAGEKPALVYMDLYQRSMRLMGLIAAQYDPHARPFITLTHHWAKAGEKRWYGSRTMIRSLLAFTRAEGDFPWALAYHPYPQNLFNPRTWEDRQATLTFDTDKITPRNLEVLDAYMRQPALLDRGQPRPVHLSENGFNSKDYSPKSLEDQAAGMALAWKKIQRLPTIGSWQYHNWIDNRGEGGLRIGLRKFPDEPGDPLGRKPIWHLYQALGTAAEDEACAPYLMTIGIPSWDGVIQPVAAGTP